MHVFRHPPKPPRNFALRNPTEPRPLDLSPIINENTAHASGSSSPLFSRLSASQEPDSQDDDKKDAEEQDSESTIDISKASTIDLSLQVEGGDTLPLLPNNNKNRQGGRGGYENLPTQRLAKSEPRPRVIQRSIAYSSLPRVVDFVANKVSSGHLLSPFPFPIFSKEKER